METPGEVAKIEKLSEKGLENLDRKASSYCCQFVSHYAVKNERMYHFLSFLSQKASTWSLLLRYSGEDFKAAG